MASAVFHVPINSSIAQLAPILTVCPALKDNYIMEYVDHANKVFSLKVDLVLSVHLHAKLALVVRTALYVIQDSTWKMIFVYRTVH